MGDGSNGIGVSPGEETILTRGYRVFSANGNFGPNRNAGSGTLVVYAMMVVPIDGDYCAVHVGPMSLMNEIRFRKEPRPTRSDFKPDADPLTSPIDCRKVAAGNFCRMRDQIKWCEFDASHPLGTAFPGRSAPICALVGSCNITIDSIA